MDLDFPVLTGAETIVHFLGASHVITNGRVHLTRQGATLEALVDATHLLRRDTSQRCQKRNWYRAEFVEVDQVWRIWRLLAGSGRHWMLTVPDGYMRMDVRTQIQTGDGAAICAHYFGPAEANAKLMQAVRAFQPTEFGDHSIRSHWVLETGDPRYRWLNQSVFADQGRLFAGRP